MVESSLTAYVADFIVSTRPQDIPPDVAHLGRRSVLDGLGLALAGSVSETGRIAQRYLAALGLEIEHGSVVIGTGTRRRPRCPPCWRWQSAIIEAAAT